MSTLLNQAKKSVKEAKVHDQTEEGPAFVYEPTPEGRHRARFIGYVELGMRDGGEWKGKKKPDVLKAYLYYELYGKKVEKIIEVDGVEKTINPIHREMIDVKVGEKANMTKLFKKMVAGRDGITHIAQMLEEPFLLSISHNEVEKDGKKRIYENIKTKDDGYTLSAPIIETMDDEGETTVKKIKVPDQIAPTRLLLWEDPTVEQWDSIFVDGEYEREVDGKTITVSKNFVQNDILSEAKDFEGSPLEALLAGKEMPDLGVVDDEDEDLDDTPDAPEDYLTRRAPLEDAALDNEGVEPDAPNMSMDDDDEIPF